MGDLLGWGDLPGWGDLLGWLCGSHAVCAKSLPHLLLAFFSSNKTSSFLWSGGMFPLSFTPLFLSLFTFGAKII